MARRVGVRKIMLGIDPGLENTGYGIAKVNPETGRIHEVLEIGTFKTLPSKLRPQRKTSDHVRRAKEQASALASIFERVPIDMVAAEIATTTPYTNPTFSFGVMIGILASLGRPIIEVLPYEAKLASGGSERATKRDVIAWAMKLPLAPAANWPTSRRSNNLQIAHGDGFVTKAAEHPADALAVIQAAMATDQFRLAHLLSR